MNSSFTIHGVYIVTNFEGRYSTLQYIYIYKKLESQFIYSFKNTGVSHQSECRIYMIKLNGLISK